MKRTNEACARLFWLMARKHWSGLSQAVHMLCDCALAGCDYRLKQDRRELACGETCDPKEDDRAEEQNALQSDQKRVHFHKNECGHVIIACCGLVACVRCSFYTTRHFTQKERFGLWFMLVVAGRHGVRHIFKRSVGQINVSLPHKVMQPCL